MDTLPTATSRQHIDSVDKKPVFQSVITAYFAFFSFLVVALTVLTLTVLSLPIAHAEPGLPKNQGLFLVATDKLAGTSFQEAVILITHYSKRGATGLTINRPTEIPLNHAFPRIPQFQQRTDPLYLGGPVSTNAIFMLIRTDTPLKNMHLIANNIYFSTAKNAFKHPVTNSSRTYAGYAGWASGQLQNEIDRGDWLLVHTPPDIIFEQKINDLWQTLFRRWSGDWI